MDRILIAPFLDRVAESLPGWPDKLPASWVFLRRMVEARYIEGGKLYGNDYRRKDNIAEAMEEAADFVCYMGFDLLVAGEQDCDLALGGMRHTWEAVEDALRRRSKQGGNTGPPLGDEEKWPVSDEEE